MKELLRAVFVIARRDFTAVIFSKAFIFFLLGPLFPVLIGAIAGYLGEDMSGANEPPSVGLVLGEGETKALIKARERLASALGPTTIPQLKSGPTDGDARSEEHTSELQSLMRISYAVFCLKKKKQRRQPT